MRILTPDLPSPYFLSDEYRLRLSKAVVVSYLLELYNKKSRTWRLKFVSNKRGLRDIMGGYISWRRSGASADQVPSAPECTDGVGQM